MDGHNDNDEDAPDVDYEGEEEEEEEGHDPVGPTPSSVAAESEASKQGKKLDGAGDSETETDDDDGDKHKMAPPAPPVSTGLGGREGAGDSDTNSEEVGEVGGGGAISEAVAAAPSRDDKFGREQDEGNAVAAAHGYRRPPPSKMDRALDAPRETPGKRDEEGGRRDRDGVPPRRSRWGERVTTNKPDAAREGPAVYVPPAKRRLLEEERKALEVEAGGGDASGFKESGGVQAEKKTPARVQRQTWEALQRSINGCVNRLSPSTIKPLIHSLFSEANLLRGRGVLARSVLKASQASPQFTPAYAALMAVVNTKLPECGELLLTRAILAFRGGYKRRDRNGVSSSLALLGHLFNQGMANELLSLQILTVLLDGDPTEDSVDVAVGYMCVVGRQLKEVSPTGVRAVMERFRGLLHEGSVGRRAQYRIETLLKIKRGGFKDYPTIPDEEQLDLVEREDQITHELGLDDEGLHVEEALDSFSYDEDYDEKEEEWKNIRAEILEDDTDSESGSGSTSGSDSGSESGSEDEKDMHDQALSETGDKKTVVVEDLTETDLVHLRRTIYLTIMSSATFEECTHKLAKMDIPPGRESELINMIIECCSQERTFLRYYGLVSGRFCLLHERWQDAFEEAFNAQYNTIHRLETNKLRNVAKLFGHLLHTDSISWSVLACIHLNEDETTSSSRIFIKILVQEMAEAMGMVTLKQRFDTDNPDPDGPVGEEPAAAAPRALVTKHRELETSARVWFKGMFPKDNARNTRYAINFFTSIGLGPLTDGMREFLKNAPKLILAQAQAAAAREAAQKNDDESSVISTSSSDTSSFDSSSSSSSSGSGSSYSSSSLNGSYSSVSSYRRKKSSGKRGRKRVRGRRSRSYSSSSSSGSDSSPDRRGGRRKYSKNEKCGGGHRNSKSNDHRDKRGQDDSSSKAKSPDTGSKRSVSVSPPARRSRKDGSRHRRSRSPSLSPSPARSPSKRSGRGPEHDGHPRSGKDVNSRSPSPSTRRLSKSSLPVEGRKKRARSPLSGSSSARSRSRSPDVQNNSRRDRKKSDDKKRSRRDRVSSNIRSMSRDRM